MVKVKRCYVVILVILLVSLLIVVGCGKKDSVNPEQTSEKTESVSTAKVEAANEKEPEKTALVVEPKAEAVEISTEFEDVKAWLLDSGIIKEDTPVYEFGDIVEFNNSRFYMDRFVWSSTQISFGFRFIEESLRDEKGDVWRHHIRFIVDGELYSSTTAYTREADDGFRVVRSFQIGIPDSYEEHVLVFIKIKEPSRTVPRYQGLENALREGDVVFIVTRDKISFRDY